MLDRDRWQRIERILDDVLDAEPVARASVLARACGGDERLRQEVEALLANERSLPPLLADEGTAVVSELARQVVDEAPVDALVGSRLGPWRVRHEIGYGGMARVFLAERADGEFAQRAAVKVLRAGLDGQVERSRFEAERRILASLDHPFIARLLDGGVAPDGRPFFVLEYVEGMPITTFCSSRALDIRARLALFRDVCEAVAAAHRELVVHRDLKPTNILVDAGGRPRLLDFGIAKLLEDVPAADVGARPAHPPLTRTRWLTPDYAAPEQFRGERVTTLTDVYQLGIILYELLAEVRPFGAEALATDPLRTREPPPPSAHRRSIAPDLDAIVAKAMRTDPSARYASVTALADDVRRHLEGAPVRARIGDRSYRWRRALRRNAWPIAAAVGTAVALVTWGVTVSVQNRRIREALALAEEERAKSVQTADFLAGLFRVSDPQRGRVDSISARTLLERAEARIDALDGQPAAQATLLGVLGRVRGDLGAFEEGERALRRAIALREADGEPPDVERALTHAELARLSRIAGRPDSAAFHYDLAYRTLRRLLGDTAEQTRTVLYDYAFTLHASRRMAEADSLFSAWQRSLPLDAAHRDRLRPRQLLDVGRALAFGRDPDPARRAEGERLIERAHALATTRRDDDPSDFAASASALARVRFDAGDADAAARIMAEGVEALRTVHPNGHPELAAALQVRATFLIEGGRVAEGMIVYDSAVAMAGASYGVEHLMTAAMLGSYGDALRRAGWTDSAIVVLTRAEQGLARFAGDDNVMTLRTRANLGEALGRSGAQRPAERLLLAAWERLSQSRGSSDRHAQYALGHLIRFYEAAGRLPDAARFAALVVEPGDAPRGTPIR